MLLRALWNREGVVGSLFLLGVDLLGGLMASEGILEALLTALLKDRGRAW
jgi:hypothetical protein